jgi:hypothetical protein
MLQDDIDTSLDDFRVQGNTNHGSFHVDKNLCFASGKIEKPTRQPGRKTYTKQKHNRCE